MNRRRADCKCMHTITYYCTTTTTTTLFSEIPSVIDPFYCCSSTSLDTIVIQRRGRRYVLFTEMSTFLLVTTTRLVDQSDRDDLKFGTVLNVITFHSEIRLKKIKKKKVIQKEKIMYLVCMSCAWRSECQMNVRVHSIAVLKYS